METISILGVNTPSNYDNFPGLDLWTKERDLRNYKGNNPVITHAPCQQWSKLKHFAKKKEEEKELAYICWEWVNRNGGIFEHPAGSSFFDEVKADRSKIYSVNLHWFGFKAEKRTYLYFHKVKPLAMPMRLDAIETTIERLHSSRRSDTPTKMRVHKRGQCFMPPIYSSGC